MARITTFGKRKIRGVCIGSLPMPDGSKRAYKEYGRDALRVILLKWEEDKANMKAAMFLATREA